MCPSSNPLNLCRYVLRDLLRWTRRSWKTAGLGLAIAAAVVYLTLAFIPLPAPISPGLDSAWQYRLSQFANDEAVFGRDAISFYGALGYWLSRAIVGDNFDTIFIVRLSLHLLLVVVATLKILRLYDPLMRLALVVGLIFPSAIADFVPSLQTEWQIVAIWLLLLSIREFWEKGRRPWALGFGAAAGVALNVHAELGVTLLASLYLALALRNASDWKQEPSLETGAEIVFELLTVGLAFGVTTTLALAPRNGDLLWRSIVAVGAATTIGYGLLPQLLHRLPLARLSPAFAEIFARLERGQYVQRIGACLGFALGLLYQALFTEPSLMS